MFSEQKLTPADAAIFETFVVPRYLSFYGDLVLEMLLAGGSVRIAHLGCRTGYPDLKIYERIDQTEIVGFDTSIPALELARNKATVRGADTLEYRVQENGVMDDETGQFTHVIALHPEYHALLEAPESNLEREFPPETGSMNPFLHLSLHLAVAEQLAIDQPPGIRVHYERLRLAHGDEHRAHHAVLECLGEVLWNAQRHGTAPEAALYLGCLERQR